MNSAFKHLTDTAIGFDDQETPDMDFDSLPAEPNDIEKENLNNDNSSPMPAVNVSTPLFSDIVCSFRKQ